MTRKSRRELEHDLEALEDDHDERLGWVDHLRIEAGDAAPSDYGLTAAEVRQQFRELVGTDGGVA